MASQKNQAVEKSPLAEDLNPQDSLWQSIQSVLKPIASLRLTVVLFLMSIFIVLTGTLAQVDADIWEVIRVYFRVDFARLFPADSLVNVSELFVWIEPKLFFPPSFFPPDPIFPKGLGWMASFWPHGTPDFPERAGLWFPKGWVIGTVMMCNLLAAHLIRFRIRASGTRLITGFVILGIGTIMTTLVILAGSSGDGLQNRPLVSYDTVRWFMLMTILGLCGVSTYAAIAAGSEKSGQRWLFSILSVLLAFTWVVALKWDASDEAAMRILYQLLKATFAALVLLTGCILIFKQRSGIVLLHAGIALMMFYDVLVGVRHVESQMRIEEGRAANFSRDIRTVELAVIDRSGSDTDRVTVIPAPMLIEGESLTDDRLPFDIEIVRYMRNSDLRALRSFTDEEPPQNPATAGIGEQFVAMELQGAAGTDMGGEVDIPSAYIKLTHQTLGDLGVYLVTAFPDMAPGMISETQTIEVGEETYNIALRYVRMYKRYTITLNDVQKNDYKGTNRPKDFSSFITVKDPDAGIEFDNRIWMNNPMRYAGETFYQSSYIPPRSARSRLQRTDRAPGGQQSGMDDSLCFVHDCRGRNAVPIRPDATPIPGSETPQERSPFLTP